MAGQHLAKQKTFRIEELSLQNKTERADRIAYSDAYSPLFKNQFYHAEDEPNEDELNDDLRDIINDLFIVEGEFVILAQEYEKLILSSVQKIDASRKEVIAAREKIMDLNMLCAEGSGFFQVTSITNDLFLDNTTVNKDGTITARPSGAKKMQCFVQDVVGNGLEGNEYVYVDNKFVFEESYTGIRDYMTDGNITTIYEYQKLNADTSEPYLFSELSLTSTEAFCTITIMGKEAISSVKVITPDTDTIVQEVQVSQDGENYTSVLNEDIKINKKETMYKDPKYVYEAGIIAFPLSKYIKITLSSDGHTNERIAFIHEYLE